MTEEALIYLDRSNCLVSLTQRAAALLNEALVMSALIGAVRTPEENGLAVEVVSVQKRLGALLEEARVRAKHGALEECREIDRKVAIFRASLDDEIMRVGKLMGDYVTLVEAKRRDEELAKRRDLEELERQKRAAMAGAQSHEEREATQERFEAMQQAVQATPAAVVELPKGQSAREDWEYEVTDVHALYRAYPHAVKLEPKRSEIRVLLNRHHGEIAGVKARAVVKAQVAPQRESKALELSDGPAAA